MTDRGNLKLTLSSYIGGYLLGLALFDEAPCWSVHLFELDPALVKELISDCNIHYSALILTRCKTVLCCESASITELILVFIRSVFYRVLFLCLVFFQNTLFDIEMCHT